MDILAFLSAHDIPFEHFEHPPVFTCEEAAIHLKGVPGSGTKNLFLRNKKGDKHFLVSVPEAKRVDLKTLSKVLGEESLSFASAERLQKHLGLEPGSVTLLGVVNDTESAVTVYIDEELFGCDALQCHPLVNTATVVLTPSAIQQFFAVVEKRFGRIAIPATI